MTRTERYTIFTIIVLMICTLICAIHHTARATEPTDVQQLVIVVGYENGKAVGGQVLGISDSLEGCQKGLEQTLPELKAKPGVTIAAVCTPLPPAPPAVQHQGETSI